MNKYLKFGIIGILVFLAVSVMIFVGMYNGLVSAGVTVDNNWSQVRIQLQRRYDLIPNIVEATKDYMAFEASLLTNITLARSAWANSLSNGNVETQMQAGDQLGEATRQIFLLATVENYPQLGSQEVVLTMLDELAGTENRIAYRRELYNTAVANYNRGVQSIPTNIIAGMTGFTIKPY